MTYLIEAADKINSNDLQGALAKLVEGLAKAEGLDVEYSDVPERFGIFLSKDGEMLTNTGNVDEAEPAAPAPEAETPQAETPQTEAATADEAQATNEQATEAAPAAEEGEAANG